MGERRLDRLFPERRQAAPDRAHPRLLWRLAVEGSAYPDWLCAESYVRGSGDLAEIAVALLLPEGTGGKDVFARRLDAQSGCCRFPLVA